MTNTPHTDVLREKVTQLLDTTYGRDSKPTADKILSLFSEELEKARQETHDLYPDGAEYVTREFMAGELRKAQIAEIKHWLGQVRWPNTYQAMQKKMEERIKALKEGKE